MPTTNPGFSRKPSKKFGRFDVGQAIAFCGLSIMLLLSSALTATAQIPAQDSRLTTIPHTDTHFTPRTFRTLAEWQEHRAHLRKQLLSAAGLPPLPAQTPLHPPGLGTTTPPPDPPPVFGKDPPPRFPHGEGPARTLPGLLPRRHPLSPPKPRPRRRIPRHRLAPRTLELRPPRAHAARQRPRARDQSHAAGLRRLR